jgi:hypothetical protein
MPDSIIDLRDSRLAELVASLTGCDQDGALHALRERAVRELGTTDDALALVAGAMVTVDQPEPDGFRVAGYLRDDLPTADRIAERSPDRGLPLPRRHARDRFNALADR